LTFFRVNLNDSTFSAKVSPASHKADCQTTATDESRSESNALVQKDSKVAVSDADAPPAKGSIKTAGSVGSAPSHARKIGIIQVFPPG